MRFRELQAEKELRQLQEDRKNDRKPPPYKHIKVWKTLAALGSKYDDGVKTPDSLHCSVQILYIILCEYLAYFCISFGSQQLLEPQRV